VGETDDFNERHSNAEAELRSVPTDGYESKLLTQLSGGTAPDVFYAGDALLARMIRNGNVIQLDKRLESGKSKSPPDDFFDPLWGVARADGATWGVPVDCNPICIWYNKNVLTDAGVTDEPADLFENGQWTRDAFQTMAEQAHSKGNPAAAIGDNWASVYSWMTANGGQVYVDGQFVAHEDEKSVDAFLWMCEMLKSKVFIYTGGLPAGQGQESLFMSNKLAFSISVGRWVLPIFRENDALDTDIVPYPSFDGKLASTPVAVAHMVVNSKAKDIDRAFTFLTEFVSRKGQIFRLQGQGNAVPSIRGADQVVLEGDKPAHAKYFLDLREHGYVPPLEEARTSGLSAEIAKRFGEVFAKGSDPTTGLQRIAQLANDAIAKGSVD
jgi:multiple sugar transport system substrate-binding protein